MRRADRLTWRTATAFGTVLAFLASSVLGAAYQEPATTPTPTPPMESRVRIEHDPLSCVTTVVRPLVEAQMMPGQELSKGYVYFRKTGTPYFYYTRMSGSPPDQQAKLPRPLPTTKSIDYYVQATDRAALSRKTRNYEPPVMPAEACTSKGAPVLPKEEGLTIGVTDAKAPPIPEGFNKDDIAKIILITGAVVTVAVALQSSGAAAGAGAAGGAAGTGTSTGAGAGAGAGGAAGGGGGISSTALIVGGVAVAAGVGLGVGLSGKKGTPTPRVVVNQFIEADAVWGGSGDINVTLLDPSNQSVGTPIPSGCDPSGISRTERVTLQGTSLPTGTYRVTLTGVSCGTDTPPTISTVLTVESDTGPKCSSSFINVPVGQTVTGCSFNVP